MSDHTSGTAAGGGNYGLSGPRDYRVKEDTTLSDAIVRSPCTVKHRLVLDYRSNAGAYLYEHACSTHQKTWLSEQFTPADQNSCSQAGYR